MYPEHICIPANQGKVLVAIMERIQRINKKLDNCERILKENGEANGRTATDGW